MQVTSGYILNDFYMSFFISIQLRRFFVIFENQERSLILENLMKCLTSTQGPLLFSPQNPSVQQMRQFHARPKQKGHKAKETQKKKLKKKVQFLLVELCNRRLC